MTELCSNVRVQSTVDTNTKGISKYVLVVSDTYLRFNAHSPFTQGLYAEMYVRSNKAYRRLQFTMRL